MSFTLGPGDTGHPPDSSHGPAPASTPPPENPWLQANPLALYLEAQQSLMANMQAMHAAEAAVAMSTMRATQALAHDQAEHVKMAANAEAAQHQAHAIQSMASGMMSVAGAMGAGMGAKSASFASAIAEKHDAAAMLSSAEAPASPAEQAPAMVYRSYRQPSFFEPATQSAQFVASLPGTRTVANVPAPATSAILGSPLSPEKAPMPPVQTLRSLAQAARGAASPLMSEGFGAQASAAFASAANLFDQAARPGGADASAQARLGQEVQAQFDAIHALLAELAKGQFQEVENRQSKKGGAIDAFKGHSAEAVANAPNQNLSSSLKAVSGLATQLLAFNAESHAPAVREAQRTAAGLIEVTTALENAGVAAPEAPASQADPKAKTHQRPKPDLRRAISIGATKALERTAAFLKGPETPSWAGLRSMAMGTGLAMAGSALAPASAATPTSQVGMGSLGFGAMAGIGVAGTSGGIAAGTSGNMSAGKMMGGASGGGTRGSMIDAGFASGLAGGMMGSVSGAGMMAGGGMMGGLAGPAQPLRPGMAGFAASPMPRGFGSPTAGNGSQGSGAILPAGGQGGIAFSMHSPAPEVPRGIGPAVPMPILGRPPIVPFTPSIGPSVGSSPTPTVGGSQAPNIGSSPMPTVADVMAQNIGGSPTPTVGGAMEPNIGGAPLSAKEAMDPNIGGSLTPTVGEAKAPNIGGAPLSAREAMAPNVGGTPSLTLGGSRVPGIGGSPVPTVAGAHEPGVGGSPFFLPPPPEPHVGSSPTPGAGPIDGIAPKPWKPGGENPAANLESNPSALRDSLVQTGGPGIVPDPMTRGKLEPHLGFDPANARIHTGPEAAQAAQDLKAQAFTVGQDIFFGKGKYDPNTAQGLSLIGHEATHVGQQTGALGDRVQRFTERGGDEMEREAREVARRIYNHHPGALQVEEYVCDFVSGSGKFAGDEEKRLERLSMEAFEAAEKALSDWNGDLESVAVNLTIAPAEMSDGQIVMVWKDAIVNAVRLASASSPAPKAGNAAIQKFDSYEHVQLGESTADGKTRKHKITEQLKDEQTMTPEERQKEYASIFAYSEPPANVKDEKDDAGKPIYIENRWDFLHKGLTYGEVIALSGDHFGSVKELMGADLKTVTRLIPLIRSKGTSLKDYVKANPEFLKLALNNEAHFSDPKNPVNNKNTYRQMHADALNAGDLTQAMMMNAAADHFLTDAFASGHMRVPRAALDKVGMAVGAIPIPVSKGISVPLFGILEGVAGLVGGAMTATDKNHSLLGNLWDGLTNSPHIIGGLMSMGLHDWDNSHGVKVRNARGEEWMAYGDDNLNAGKTDSPEVQKAKAFHKQVTTEAVLISQHEIQQMFLSSGVRKKGVTVPHFPYAAEDYIPVPIQGYGDEIKSAAMDAVSGIQKVIADTAKTVRQAVWGGKDAQEYVLTHQDELDGLTLERKREIMGLLARRLVSAKDREAVAVLYRHTQGEQRNALAMEFGAQFSESPYAVRSAAALVPPVSPVRVAQLQKKGVFNADDELKSVDAFQNATDFGYFGIGRDEGLTLVDKMLGALHALGPVPLGGKDPSKQAEALLLVSRSADVLRAYTDQLGSTTSVQVREALIEMIVSLEAWREALGATAPAGATGKGLAAMDDDMRATVEQAKQYSGSFDGSADSVFRSVGHAIDAVLIKPNMSMEASFQLKIPIEEFVHVGFSLKVSAEREQDVKIAAEASGLTGIGASAGDAKASLDLYKGSYMEARAKTGGEAMALYSYGMYHSMRESPIPPDIPSHMWGGIRGSGNEAYRRAEIWSGAMEKDIFQPLADRLKAAKTEKEKQEAEEAIKNTYIELGNLNEISGMAKADKDHGAKASVRLQTGTRYDMASVQAAEGGLGGHYIRRYLGDSFLKLGRGAGKAIVGGNLDIDPFGFEGKFEVSRLGATQGAKDAEWGVKLNLAAEALITFEALSNYSKYLSKSVPKMIAWAAQIASQYPDAGGPGALAIGNEAGKLAESMGESMSMVFEWFKPVDDLGLNPKLAVEGEGSIQGTSPEGTVKLNIEADPHHEGDIVDAELKVKKMLLGAKFDKSGAHQIE